MEITELYEFYIALNKEINETSDDTDLRSEECNTVSTSTLVGDFPKKYPLRFDRIFKYKERDSKWLTENYQQNIPLYFNFLNTNDFEVYEKYLLSLVRDKQPLSSSSSSLLPPLLQTVLNTNESAKESQANEQEDHDCERSFSDVKSLADESIESNANNTNNNNNNNDETESISQKNLSTAAAAAIDYESFKKSKMHTQMMIKIYGRFLYAFGKYKFLFAICKAKIL
jgi:hypothetical protein